MKRLRDITERRDGGACVTVTEDDASGDIEMLIDGKRAVTATKNAAGGSFYYTWVGTQAQYDAIAVKDANTQYNIVA